MHCTIMKFSLILSTIRPSHTSISRYLILNPFPCINLSCVPNVFSFSLLIRIVIISFIKRTIRPAFNTKTMLFIVQPISFIFWSLNVLIYSITISHIVFPFPFINITICMYECTISIGFIMFPFSFILSSIRPDLNPITISRIASPLSCIDCSTYKSYHQITYLKGGFCKRSKLSLTIVTLLITVFVKDCYVYVSYLNVLRIR